MEFICVITGLCNDILFWIRLEWNWNHWSLLITLGFPTKRERFYYLKQLGCLIKFRCLRIFNSNCLRFIKRTFPQWVFPYPKFVHWSNYLLISVCVSMASTNIFNRLNDFSNNFLLEYNVMIGCVFVSIFMMIEIK